ncbi:hypothetical protein Tco_0679150 [Tanacetum coccineum]|uniref:Uncharacterized protein n=1 Tax=Tanacetum coccineum TaxID=301880 RepID=A0ABQ4XH34_9ASTR
MISRKLNSLQQVPAYLYLYYPSVLRVLVSIISEPTVLTPAHETSSGAPVTTLPLPSVSITPPVPQQTTTPIPTPLITTDAPTITTATLESNALFVVQLRVVKLEKDVFELKNVDHSTATIATLKSQVPSPNDDEMQWTRLLTQSKDALKKHDNDEDDDYEDPPAGPNQGKKTKRRRIKESESSKKPSTTKETLKGKDPFKGSKTGKSASAKESAEEPTSEVNGSRNLQGLLLLIQNGTSVKLYLDNLNSLGSIKWSLLQRILSHSTTSWPLLLTSPSHPDHLTVAADYLFNNDLEYLKSSDPERTYTTSITKTKVAWYEIEGIKEMVPTLWSLIKVGYDKDALKGIKH